MRRVMCLCILLMLLTACQTEPAVVGCWVSEESPDYYFQLYEDGSCMMFNAQDEWVSSGTYQVRDGGIWFVTDTGTFIWAKENDAMRFEANGRVVYYRMQ